jgi:hypothetical protein
MGVHADEASKWADPTEAHKVPVYSDIALVAKSFDGVGSTARSVVIDDPDGSYSLAPHVNIHSKECPVFIGAVINAVHWFWKVVNPQFLYQVASVIEKRYFQATKGGSGPGGCQPYPARQGEPALGCLGFQQTRPANQGTIARLW